MGPKAKSKSRTGVGGAGVDVEAAETLTQQIERNCMLDSSTLLDLLHAQQPACGGVQCKDSKKSNPNCLCALAPAPGGYRKKGLWQKDQSCKAALGQDPNDAARTDKLPVGLRNLGNTCYANAALQCIFGIPSLRNAFFSIDPHISENGIIHEMQQLFLHMQFGPHACADTASLAKCLMLSTGLQQDGQEFWKLLTNKVENLFAQSTQQELRQLLPSLFKGHYSYVMTCQTCGRQSASSSKRSDYYELTPTVKGFTSLSHSLVDSLSAELMDDVSCDFCDRKTSATRRQVLRDLPPYLCLALQRFYFDMQKLEKAKASDKFSFPLELDMSACMAAAAAKNAELFPGDVRGAVDGATGGDDSIAASGSVVNVVSNGCHGSKEAACASSSPAGMYELVSVLIHKGSSASSGHYVAHIKDQSSGTWWRFDDSTADSMGPYPTGFPADHGTTAAASTGGKAGGEKNAGNPKKGRGGGVSASGVKRKAAGGRGTGGGRGKKAAVAAASSSSAESDEDVSDEVAAQIAVDEEAEGIEADDGSSDVEMQQVMRMSREAAAVEAAGYPTHSAIVASSTPNPVSGGLRGRQPMHSLNGTASIASAGPKRKKGRGGGKVVQASSALLAEAELQQELQAQASLKAAAGTAAAPTQVTSSNAYMLLYRQKGWSEAPAVSSIAELPDALQQAAAGLIADFAEECASYRRREAKMHEEARQRKEAVRSTLSLAQVTADPHVDEGYWVATSWLETWANSEHHPPPIDNSSLVCRHGSSKLDPDKTTAAKRISSEAWSSLHALHGGGPTLRTSDACLTCISARLNSIIIGDRADHYRDVVSSLLASQEAAGAADAEEFMAVDSDDDEGMYYVSRAWLTGWLKRQGASVKAEKSPTADLACPHGLLLPKKVARRVAVPCDVATFLKRLWQQERRKVEEAAMAKAVASAAKKAMALAAHVDGDTMLIDDDAAADKVDLTSPPHHKPTVESISDVDSEVVQPVSPTSNGAVGGHKQATAHDATSHTLPNGANSAPSVECPSTPVHAAPGSVCMEPGTNGSCRAEAVAAANSVQPTDIAPAAVEAATPSGTPLHVLDFPVTTSVECSECAHRLGHAKAVAAEARQGWEGEKTALSSLAANVALTLEVGPLYHLVPSSWVRSWQCYVNQGSAKVKPAAAAVAAPAAVCEPVVKRPPPLAEVMLRNFCSCCDHGAPLLAVRPPALASKRGRLQQSDPDTDNLRIITQSEWQTLATLYGPSNSQAKPQLASMSTSTIHIDDPSAAVLAAQHDACTAGIQAYVQHPTGLVLSREAAVAGSAPPAPPQPLPRRRVGRHPQRADFEYGTDEDPGSSLDAALAAALAASTTPPAATTAFGLNGLEVVGSRNQRGDHLMAPGAAVPTIGTGSAALAEGSAAGAVESTIGGTTTVAASTGGAVAGNSTAGNAPATAVAVALAPAVPVLLTLPGVCERTLGIAEQESKQAALTYADVEVMVEVVKKEDLLAEGTNTERAERKSRRARKGRVPLQLSSTMDLLTLRALIYQSLGVHPRNQHIHARGVELQWDDNAKSLGELEIYPQEDIRVVASAEHDNDDAASALEALGSAAGNVVAGKQKKREVETGFANTALQDTHFRTAGTSSTVGGGAETEMGAASLEEGESDVEVRDA